MPDHATGLALPDADLDARRAAPRLRASWQRSAAYGVAPDAVNPVFTGALDTGSLLYECGHQVLSALQSTLGTEPISLMIADHEGLVLARLCNDSAIRRSLDKVHLAPGFSYNERNAGTNGLGLSLADRAPALVRAADHYCSSLRGYTCAAVPVLDPHTGALAGSVNLTTWSDSSADLLLALAQSAAGNTAALMALRSSGRTVRPAPRGEVFHVTGEDPAGGRDAGVSRAWRRALADAGAAVAGSRVLAVVGEPGVGKGTLAAHAHRGVVPRARILRARTPGDEVGAWLELWTPELAIDETCVVVSGVDTLPAWAADDLGAVFAGVRRHRKGPASFVVTATDFGAIPAPVAAVVDTVVELPPLRERPDDIWPLAERFARQGPRRRVSFTSAARHAVTGFHWPGNATQLRTVVREAAARADVVDVHHLAPEVLTRGGHTLTRLETLERDEIVRCLAEPGTTVGGAAATLGLGRATLYRKIAQYGIEVPQRRTAPKD